MLDRVPVDLAAEMRDGREDVETFTALGRERWIRARRGVEVEGEISGEDFLLEDVFQ